MWTTILLPSRQKWTGKVIGRLPPEVAQTLQMFVGVALTPDVSPGEFSVLSGSMARRGCGKSAFMEIERIAAPVRGEGRASKEIGLSVRGSGYPCCRGKRSCGLPNSLGFI